VNKVALKERCSRETQQLCSDESVNIPRDKKIALMQKYAAFNESMISDLRICPYVDPQIKKIVETEVHAFFADKTSAEDAAHILQRKVSLYLNE